MLRKLHVIICLTFLSLNAWGQFATVSGIVKDENGKPLDYVVVAVTGTDIGTHTNAKGYYILQVPANKNISVAYSATNYLVQVKNVSLRPGDLRTWDVILKQFNGVLPTVTVKSQSHRNEPGSVVVDIAKANINPGPIGGVEGLIKTLVGSNNELTSQYSVRGGNYDENLVYVDDFEIYRPFLVRAGQQEGLSFINPDLVSSVNFSVGGFQSKYGDKMASVLDVNYKTPKEFSGSVMASLLGANLHLEGISKNKKLTYLLGARQKSDQYLLQSQPTKGVYNPSFTDIQGLVNYKFNSKWEMEFIGNYARNRFRFIPETEKATFGVLNQAYELDVLYTGGEIDQFDSRFGGFSTTWRPNRRLKLKLLLSGFQTNEQETYDISGEYLLGLLQTDLGKQNFGQVQASLGTGLVQNYVRDYLKVNVGTVAFRGYYDGDKHYIQWGLDATSVSINDDLHEWTLRDSSNFSQPYMPYSIQLQDTLFGKADFNYMRYSGFIQDNFHPSDSSGFTGSIGIRYSYSDLNNELLFSPRLQLADKPDWKRDVVFKFAAGIYVQPPFYREMRAPDGSVNKDLKAQKSYHLVLGADYDFKNYGRPYKLTAELYYKGLWDIDPYTYNNILIQYYAKNDGVGYIYGGEVRLYADIVKDATSWISVGIMKAAYSITDDTFYRYTPLPNDQRFTLGMYFEDYLPRNKNFKVHLNGIFSSGLPFGPPGKPAYADTLRMPSYKRVDIGFSALLLDASRKQHPAHSYFSHIQSIWGSLEVFNLLGIQNTLSYTWIQDQTSGRTFAVPNRLTSRLLNVKLIFKF
jgi:hypothetical protein